VFLFCDGSGADGRMGIAVILRFGRAEKVVVRPAGEGTAEAAELEAVLVGLKHVRRPDLGIVIVNDSVRTIEVLTGQAPPGEDEARVQAIVEIASRFEDLRFLQVVKIDDIPENAEVTELSRRAAEEGLVVDDLRAAGEKTVY
jgi:ribonuclease HI